jgi:hypothetical protein
MAARGRWVGGSERSALSSTFYPHGRGRQAPAHGDGDLWSELRRPLTRWPTWPPSCGGKVIDLGLARRGPRSDSPTNRSRSGAGGHGCAGASSRRGTSSGGVACGRRGRLVRGRSRAGVATRLDPDLRLCKTTTVTGDAATSSETSRDAAGAVTGEMRTAAGATKQTTETCEPLGVPEMAVLSLPSLVLIAPILKGINIAGLFGVDFREFQSRVAQQATDQVVRVIIEQKFGDQATAAVKQAASGEVTDLPQA